jgi:CheY-like chemotaxis protein
MKLLLIEDNPSWADDVGAVLRKHIPELALTVAGSRDAALAELASGVFDYIICDLKIPPSDAGLDAEVEHGRAVIEIVASQYSGTPRMILSAFGEVEYQFDVAEGSDKLDAIGDGQLANIIVYRDKHRLDKAVEIVVGFATRLRSTVDIEVSQKDGDAALSYYERRLVQMLARRVEGRLVKTSRIGGGLSETTTLDVRIFDSQGTLRAKLFVKTGSLDILQREKARYERHVAPLLQIGLFAHLIHRVEAGAGSRGALAYGLGEGRTSLTDVMLMDSSGAAMVVAKLAESQQGWMVGGQTTETSVSDICQVLGTVMRDSVAEHINDLDYQAFETRTALITRAVQHGDLHAENVLVDVANAPLLVDYGETGDLIAGFDPIALELSLLFHPKVKLIRGEWPTPAQAEAWLDLDAYVAGCPQEEVVRQCRKWALSVADSKRALLACVYAHAIRQLGYKDTDKKLARALIKGAIALW